MLSYNICDNHYISILSDNNYIFRMLGSAFFPRYYHTRQRRQSIPRNQSISLNRKSNSKQKTQQSNLSIHKHSINLHSLQVKPRSCRPTMINENKIVKMPQKFQQLSQNQLRLGGRKKTLCVMGICKKPSIQLKLIEQYKEATLPLRQSATSQTRRFRRKVTVSAATCHIDRIGTSAMETKYNSPNLTKRKSRDTYLFKGWDIVQDDFPEF